MSLPRFFSPTVTVRLFDPMPLPRRPAPFQRRKRCGTTKRRVKNKEVKPDSIGPVPKKFTYKVRTIPFNA